MIIIEVFTARWVIATYLRVNKNNYHQSIFILLANLYDCILHYYIIIIIIIITIIIVV